MRSFSAADVASVREMIPATAAKTVDGYMRGSWSTKGVTFNAGVTKIGGVARGAFGHEWNGPYPRFRATAACLYSNGSGGVVVGGPAVDRTDEDPDWIFNLVNNEEESASAEGWGFFTEEWCEIMYAIVTDAGTFEAITSGNVMAE